MAFNAIGFTLEQLKATHLLSRKRFLIAAHIFIERRVVVDQCPLECRHGTPDIIHPRPAVAKDFTEGFNICRNESQTGFNHVAFTVTGERTQSR